MDRLSYPEYRAVHGHGLPAGSPPRGRYLYSQRYISLGIDMRQEADTTATQSQLPQGSNGPGGVNDKPDIYWMSTLVDEDNPQGYIGVFWDPEAI